MELILEDPTLAAYEAFAPFYDIYTHDYEHDQWIANVEAVARRHGLRGTRLLDVGCGTGKSFIPMLARGYDVTACDLSSAMVERAHDAVAGAAVELLVADVRRLPVLGQFDITTCMDDALNYLHTDDELAMAFEGVARNLRPGGLFAFDLNTLGGYRHHFPGSSVRHVDDTFFCWFGEAPAPPVGPGGVFTSVIEIFAPDSGGCWSRTTSRHVQRHHPRQVVERLLQDAGFELVQCCGQVTGGRLEAVADESVHMKVDYFARRLPSVAGPARRGRPGIAGVRRA
jgi:SAM-dependent methyltransferase